MKLIPILAALLISTIAAYGADAKKALSAYDALKSKSEKIGKDTSKEDVLEILGKPQSKGTGGWGDLETEVWQYLSFTDDSQHLSFSVHFAPNSNCAVVAIHTLRKDVEKKPLRKVSGVVQDVLPYNHPGGTDGLLCQVQMDDGGLHNLAFQKGKRVAGTPAKGANVVIEHHGSDFNLIYQGYHSLFLKSITFTKNEK